MPEIQGIEKLISSGAGKRLGKHHGYGRGMFAFSEFGDSDLYLVISIYGVSSFGKTHFGDFMIFTGIYRRDNVTGKVRYYREPFYTPKNPRSDPQQTNRGKMTAGVLAWQALTQEQKNHYNKLAIGKKMSGYNFFLKQYLLSN